MFHMVPTWISHMMKQKAKWISRMWSSMGNVSVSGVWAWYHHLQQLLLAVCQRSVLEMLHHILQINSLLDYCHPSSHPYIILTFTSMHLREEARVHREHADSTQKGLSQPVDPNPSPYCCEATVLTITPLCCHFSPGSVPEFRHYSSCETSLLFSVEQEGNWLCWFLHNFS